MQGKNAQRLRRASRARAKIRELKALRLSVHRTSQHIYAQIFDVESKVLGERESLWGQCIGIVRIPGHAGSPPEATALFLRGPRMP